jgi:hypothetical protein
VSAEVLDLDAMRELRRLTDQLSPGVPPIDLVHRIHQAAWRAHDRRWMVWALRSFDEAHGAAGCCT